MQVRKGGLQGRGRVQAMAGTGRFGGDLAPPAKDPQQKKRSWDDLKEGNFQKLKLPYRLGD